MADYTISSGDYIRPYRSPWGQCEVRSAPESTGQTFVYGDVLELDKGVSTGANRVKRGSTTGSTCNSTAIVGIAAQAASSNVAQTVTYFTASPANEFVGRTRGGLLALANVGAGFGLFRDSTKNVWLVDLGNTQSTSERVIVTELIDQVGDSGGAVAFKFGTHNSTNIIFGFGPSR
jgi:hypothetical protein